MQPCIPQWPREQRRLGVEWQGDWWPSWGGLLFSFTSGPEPHPHTSHSYLGRRGHNTAWPGWIGELCPSESSQELGN